MLKTLICAAALGAVFAVVTPVAAAAQEGSIVLGFTRTSLTFTGAGSTSSTSGAGFIVGGAISTSTSRPVGLEVEGLFVLNGSDAPTGLTLQLSYLECPVLAHADLEVSRSVRLRGYAGPQFGVLVHTGGASTTSLAGDNKDDVSRGDLSVVVGGGVNWRGTQVDLRYTRGLNSITSPLLFGPGVSARSETLGVVFAFRVW